VFNGLWGFILDGFNDSKYNYSVAKDSTGNGIPKVAWYSISLSKYSIQPLGFSNSFQWLLKRLRFTSRPLEYVNAFVVFTTENSSLNRNWLQGKGVLLKTVFASLYSSGTASLSTQQAYSQLRYLRACGKSFGRFGETEITLQYTYIPVTWRFRVSSSWSPVTNTCRMKGSLLRATTPMPALSVGTVRQHSTWNQYVHDAYRQGQMQAGMHRTQQTICWPMLHTDGRK
jgi:hypothetical protein